MADSPHKLKLEKIHGTLIILFCVSLSSPQLQIIFLLITQETTTLQQVTDGKTLNLVLKMLELFLKIQENIRISILKKKAPKLIQKRKLQTRN